LQRGYLRSPASVDPDAWRAKIRAQARRDEIRVITFRDGDRAIAVRNRAVGDQEVCVEARPLHVLRQLAAGPGRSGDEPRCSEPSRRGSGRSPRIGTGC
jgi:hypothetical protein